MLPRVRIAIAALLAIAPAAGGRAALETSALPAPRLQLLVIEVPGCFYCRLFHREVAPAYEASPRARELPLRFLDLRAAKALKLALDRPIDVVPTAVVLRDGKEVGRISGYPGRDNFMQTISYFLSLQH
jgi:thioredoxin-related protein